MKTGRVYSLSFWTRRIDFRVSCREFSGARGIGFRGSRVERNAEAGRY